MADLATRRGNVFEGLFDFRRDFDGIFNRLLSQSAQKGGGGPITLVATVPPIEARVDALDNKYHLRVALPGVEPNEVQITLQGQYLTISGEHKTEQDKKTPLTSRRSFSTSVLSGRSCCPRPWTPKKSTPSSITEYWKSRRL